MCEIKRPKYWVFPLRNDPCEESIEWEIIQLTLKVFEAASTACCIQVDGLMHLS